MTPPCGFIKIKKRIFNFRRELGIGRPWCYLTAEGLCHTENQPPLPGVWPLLNGGAELSKCSGVSGQTHADVV